MIEYKWFEKQSSAVKKLCLLYILDRRSSFMKIFLRVLGRIFFMEVELY